MLQLTVMVVGWLFAGCTGTYMYSFWKFRRIVKAERPEWLGESSGLIGSVCSSQRIFGDRRHSVALIRIAYGPQLGQLNSSLAAAYAKRIRFCLPSCLVLFAVIIGLGLVQAS